MADDRPYLHAYDVTPVALSHGKIMRHRANCICGTPFGLRDTLAEAGLDGLDHVRACEGRPSRRSEIEADKERRKNEASAKRARGGRR